jgi:hypothetical protein
MKKRKSGDEETPKVKRQGVIGNSGTASPMGQLEPPSQTANFWISVQDQLPQYYQNVIIFTGTEVLHNWARVSDGDHDYYVRTYFSSEIGDRTITDITHWCDPNNLIDFTLVKDGDTTQTARIKWSPDKTSLSKDVFEKLRQERFNPTVYQVLYHPGIREIHTPWTRTSIHKTEEGAWNMVRKMEEEFPKKDWRVEPIILED